MKYLKNSSGKRIIVQYGISYGAAVLVTVLICFGLMSMVLQRYKAEMVWDVREDIQSSAYQLDEALTEQYSIAREIYYNALTNPKNLYGGALSMRDGVAQFKLYQESAFLNDYIFARYRQGEIISQYGISTDNTFSNLTLMLDEKGSAAFLEALGTEAETTVRVLNSRQGKALLLCTYAVPNAVVGKGELIGFIISEGTLRQYLLQEFNGAGMYAVILGPGNEVLCEVDQLSSAQDTQLLRTQLLTGSVPDGDYETDIYRFSGGLTFYCAIESRQIFTEFYNMVKLVLLGSVLGITAVCLLIYFINKYNVRRIEMVRNELLRLNADHETDIENANEFQQIRYLLRKMLQKQENTVQERRQLYGNMSKHITQMLCGGLIEKEDVLHEMVVQFCPQLLNQNYAVLGAVIGRTDNGCIERLTEDPLFSVYFVNEIQDATVFSCVIGLRNGDLYGEERLLAARRLLESCSTQGIADPFVACGRTCGKLCEISRSYKEMLSLIYYSISTNYTGDTAVYEDALETLLPEIIDEKQNRELWDALTDGNIDRIYEQLQRLIGSICATRESILQAFCFDALIQYLYDALQKLQFREDSLHRLLELPRGNAESFEHALKKCIRKLYSESFVSIESVMTYIETHYKEEALGLTELAAHFHMSVSAASKYIKEKSGMKYTDYISQLRIKEACRLLETTEMSVSDITYEVGYQDSASFSKKFKAQLGVSPSAYRARHRGDGI